MNRLVIIIFIIATFFFVNVSNAQVLQTRTLTLDEAIEIGQQNSIVALEAINDLRIGYWSYRSFLATLLPQVNLNSTLPSFNKSTSMHQKDDGSYSFVKSYYLSQSFGVNVGQNIPFTGGRLSINTSAQRVNQKNLPTNYLTIPFSLALSQPLFSFNSIKWSQRIEPLKYLESKKRFVNAMEKVALTTSGYFFSLLSSKINLDIAKHNLNNSTKLYEIALGKEKIGIISSSDISQLKLGMLNASAELVKVTQNYQRKMYDFLSYLGLDVDIDLELLLPNTPPQSSPAYDEVLAIIEKNNPFYDRIELRLLEADKNLAKAKAQRIPKVNVNATVGYDGVSGEFLNSYNNLGNRQVIEVGISVPILNWGNSKGQVEVAKSNKELLAKSVEKEVSDFKQDIKILLETISYQPMLLDIYEEADSLARQRYAIAFESFKMGNINILDINNAQKDENEAKRRYIDQLSTSWSLYFSLRQMSLYDFISQKHIFDQINDKKWIQNYLSR